MLEANRKAVSAISPGIDSREIDNSARDVIKRQDMPDFLDTAQGMASGFRFTNHRI